MKRSVHCFGWMMLCRTFWGEGNSQRLAFTLAAIGAIFDTHARIFGNRMHKRQQKPLTHLWRQRESASTPPRILEQTQQHAHGKTHLEIDRLHLATWNILARIKSALQKSRKQKHSQRRRGEQLGSRDCHLQTGRGSGREGEGGRRRRRGGRGRSFQVCWLEGVCANRHMHICVWMLCLSVCVGVCVCSGCDCPRGDDRPDCYLQ